MPQEEYKIPQMPTKPEINPDPVPKPHVPAPNPEIPKMPEPDPIPETEPIKNI